jgi:hypothetical protein
VNENIAVTSVRPQPSDDELVAITSALPTNHFKKFDFDGKQN